jgi:hypothetical protein
MATAATRMLTRVVTGAWWYVTFPLIEERVANKEGSRGRWKRPCVSNSPHGHMMFRVDLVGSHGRWKRPCRQTAHMAI